MAKKQKPKKFFSKHSNLRIVLIGLTVVMFWRGAWGLLDLYLFPGNAGLSFAVSLVIGLAILFLLNNRKLRDLG